VFVHWNVLACACGCACDGTVFVILHVLVQEEKIVLRQNVNCVIAALKNVKSS
jgi:hypothetical protein